MFRRAQGSQDDEVRSAGAYFPFDVVYFVSVLFLLHHRFIFMRRSLIYSVEARSGSSSSKDSTTVSQEVETDIFDFVLCYNGRRIYSQRNKVVPAHSKRKWHWKMSKNDRRTHRQDHLLVL
ncbi:unnamed protein product [Amoebophrya sp. A25]|nr:unnamed protein product [Amoebophrya sp. A25]|eukprot:GSA25T00008857001.1